MPQRHKQKYVTSKAEIMSREVAQKAALFPFMLYLAGKVLF